MTLSDEITIRLIAAYRSGQFVNNMTNQKTKKKRLVHILNVTAGQARFPNFISGGADQNV